MAKACSLLFAVLLMSCAEGYTPPVATSRGPAASPSVAIDSAWTKQDPHTYGSTQGWMHAVYTNAVVGGTMFFEVVPTDGHDLMSFAARACENVSSERRCASTLFDREDGRSVRFTWVSVEYDKVGEVIVSKVLGEKTRYLVCTGSWTLYGSNEDQHAQQASSTDRLRTICDGFSKL